MDMSENPMLEAALSLWTDYMRSDWTELRPLWYPKESPGLTGGWARGQEAWHDLEDECEGRIVIVVNAAVKNMVKAHRLALEMTLGLKPTCWEFIEACDDAPAAFRAIAMTRLGMLPEGVVKARRATEQMCIEWAEGESEKMALEARERVWRALCAEGCGGG